jgi:hypothetical protein
LIGFAVQQTVAAMADVLARERVTAVIKPMEAAEFLIVQPDQFKSERRPTKQIKIKVRWYRQRTLRRPFSATMKTSSTILKSESARPNEPIKNWD